MRRRHSTAFVVVVSVVMLLGAIGMGLILLASGAPGALVVGTLLAAVPVAPLIWCYLWLDRYEPEPRSLLLLGLGWGAFVATSIAMALQVFDQFALGDSQADLGVVVAPITEEAAKGLFILLLLFFRRAELDGVLDGIVYAGMVGIGFAFTENILYLVSAYMGGHSAAGGLPGTVGLFIVRCLFSPFAHPLFTTFTGIGIGIAVSTRSRVLRFLAPVGGYVVAVVLHGLWNAGLMLGGGQGAVATYVFLMVPAFFLMVGFAIWMRAREGRVLSRSLADCARRGFLAPGEIPWLVRLPARRTCRRYAERAGGPMARQAMEEYQLNAIELAYLHHRYLRGTPPPDYARLGQDYVAKMHLLRSRLVWPRPVGPGALGGPVVQGRPS
ncbi:MAG: PrsW family intramembrane metalloprotease [Marmoricola sp.]